MRGHRRGDDHAELDIQRTIRDTIRDIGYNSEEIGFDADHALIQVYLKEQSPDIAASVDHSLEEREGSLEDDPFELQGAGDQGMMIGFACRETPELMPLTISLAHRLARRLAQTRKDGSLPFLRPDGKTQVTVEYDHGMPKRIEAIVVSTHTCRGSTKRDRRRRRELVIDPVLQGLVVDANTKIMVNPSGRFILGGPMADAGLTGRKIIVDTYGGIARHGGGAFTGKDPSKVDRSAAYAARHVAKNIVAAGLADRCEVQVSYAIGRGASDLDHGGDVRHRRRCRRSEMLELVRRHFDLRPGAIIANMNLQRPIYRPTAAYGHFGRDDLDVPWERTDKAEALRRGASTAGATRPVSAGS